MTDKGIFQLACKYRTAIDEAFNNGEFRNLRPFNNFPYGCCGETSYLLAEYLRRHRIHTLWISNNRDNWSHAWLVVKDKRVTTPEPIVHDLSEIADVLKGYGCDNSIMVNDNYSYEDIENGLIIDITSDQFDDYNLPVFVDYMDEFHESFDFMRAVNLSKEGYPYDREIYSIVDKYL